MQPWSAYELTKYMQRSALAELWPRTETSVYREPKNLVDRGLATARTAWDGERSRTVYAITSAGRKALRTWLSEPGDVLHFECESAVKAFLGDAGSVEDVQLQLAQVREFYEAGLAGRAAMTAGWLEGQIRFPERLHYTAMAADLIARVQGAVASWSTAWEARVAEWRTVDLDDISRAQAEACLGELLEAIHANAAGDAETPRHSREQPPPRRARTTP